MYFINPVLNILGYKSFCVTIEKAIEHSANNFIQEELNIFTTEDLQKELGKEFYIPFSKLDFSVIYKDVMKAQ